MNDNVKPFDDEQELFANDPYVEVYGDAYKEQIRVLRRYIEQKETGQDQFVVLDLEAGLGKSVKTNKILRMYFDEWGAIRNFLVVKRFKEDVEECATAVNEADYTGYCDIPAALGITADNWSKEWHDKPHELKDFRVLVITHARYQDLCLDDTMRSYFTEGRDTLIIDEKMDFPTYSFNRKKYNDILECLPPELHEQFFKVCAGLFKQITKMKLDKKRNTKIGRCDDFSCHPVTLAKFKTLVEANENHIMYGKQKQVKDFVQALEMLYDKRNRRLYNAGRISTINPKHRLWGLQNNIILDANGSIDHSYQVSNRIRVEGFDKIVNHSESQIHWIKCNTSQSNIEKHEDEFFDAVLKAVDDMRDNNKALVVTHLKFEKGLVGQLAEGLGFKVAEGDTYNGEVVAVNHFYNLIGKNTYRDFDQSWIAGTSNVPLETHVLKWMHYSEQDIGKMSLDLVSKGDALRFENVEFEQMRRSFIVGEIYQCLKRVQRRPIPEAEFFVFTKAEDVFRNVAAQMLFVQEGAEVELELNTNDDNSSEEVKPQTRAEKVANYLNSLESGTKIRKRKAFEDLGIDGTNFSMWGKNSIEITRLKDAGIIEIETHYFIRK